MAGATALLLLTTGCGDKKDEPGYGDGKPYRQTVLVYAVASNNLYSNLIDDKREMLEAAKSMNLNGLSMLVYEVTPESDSSKEGYYPKLSEIYRVSADSVAFRTLKTYDRDLYSTDPERLKAVIDDVAGLRESASYGLVFWSHGTGWDPSHSGHPTRSDETADHPKLYSFGADKDSSKNPSYTDRMDIDELSSALPDGMFNFIWFDCCYMSGIENIYQLRDKCSYFVGYPTEVMAPGMPYELTLPYILRPTADLKGAAQAFFNYYAQSQWSSYRVATIAVLDMEGVENVADYCAKAYDENVRVSVSGIQNYSRTGVSKFYDFGQYTRRMAENNPDAPDAEEFQKALDSMIIWKATTDVDFNYKPIDVEGYTGISCHGYASDDKEAVSAADREYYRTLDWYKRVYGN